MARLLEHFMPLLSYGLAIDEQVSAGNTQGSVDEVHARVRALIEQARSDARAAGKVPPAVESAVFALVAWFDEIIARLPSWRGQASPLQMQLFNTYSAGDEFFEQLSGLQATDDEVREVYYHALLLGFAGQYYFESDDHGELGRIRELTSRQLPVAPTPLQALREERITPQPYLMEDPPGPRYPTRWDALLMKVGATIARLHRGDPGDGHPDNQDAALAKLGTAIRQAKYTMARSPQMTEGRAPLYRLPWLLLLGDAGANVRGLLQAASWPSPFPAPSDDDAEAVWRWWLLQSMIAIETSPRVVCGPFARAERGLWYQALKQLAAERERLPLNGIVVCIGVRSLLDEGSALKETAARLRTLASDSRDRLQLQLPLYVLVTGLQLLPGYAVFRNVLPAAALEQVLGWRLAEKEVPDAASGAIFDSQFVAMAERLHGLRLAALVAQREATGRRGVFEFVQSISSLQQGLRQFVRLLLESDASQRTARWRGLYFVGGPSPDAPGGMFVADLFGRFLPADQPLAAFSSRMAAHR